MIPTPASVHMAIDKTYFLILYLQSQDLSGLTPEDFVDKYNQTYKKSGICW